ncbi:MAG: ABC transporter permease [Verrucomicrobiales bacterium]|nr:ABC transporter permease [Verrucomicrobiales bacterium]
MNDLKFAFRQLLKNPGFTAVAVLTLALGIGANTAIFSVVNHVLLAPLSFHDSGRLLTWWFSAPPNMPQFDLTQAHFAAFHDQNQVFESTAAYAKTQFNLAGDKQPERLEGANVTADFFRVLGIHPIHGRTFLPEEDLPGRNLVCLISHALWQRRFGGDLNVIGRSLNLDEIPTQVIGITPPEFDFPRQTEVWVPVGLDAQNNGFHYLSAVGRLKRGVSPDQAQAQLEVITQNFVRAKPDQYPKGLHFATVSRPLKQAMVKEVQKPLLLLLVAVGLLLLVACANVANLILARAISRSKEIAIRFALGASRQRVILQSLTESFLLASLGAGAGLLLAHWGIGLLSHLPVNGIPRIDQVRVEIWSLSFTLALTVITALVFGLAPAVTATNVKPEHALRGSSRSSLSAASRRVNDVLVVLQFAMSLILLIGAGLLLRSFQQLLAVQPGFRAQNVLALEVSLPGTRYTNAAQAEIFYAALRERALALPGVEAAGLVNHRPLSGTRWEGHYSIEGEDPTPERLEGLTTIRIATPGYFDTMGMPLLVGRSMVESDRADSPLVAVVDETLARRHWPGDTAVGKRLRMGKASENTPWMTVVGVVPSVKDESLSEDPAAHIYRPFAQAWQTTMDLAIRTTGEPLALEAALRSQVAKLDPQLAVDRVEMMGKRLTDSLSPRKAINGLLVGFASVALVLASVGIYGVISLSVGRRRLELGIRMALGAQRSNVLALVLSHGMKLAGAGIVAGLAGAFALTSILRNLLFGVSPTDLLTFVAVPLLLASVALLTCWLPARRATKVDPIEALRHE